MDELAKLQTEALDNYFIALSQFGYKNYDDVYKLLALLFLEELLTDFRGFVTQDDIRTISRVIYCLCGTTCLIDFPEYYDKVEEVEPFIAPPIKFTDFKFQNDKYNISDYRVYCDFITKGENIVACAFTNAGLSNDPVFITMPSYVLRVKGSSDWRVHYIAKYCKSIFEYKEITLVETSRNGDFIIPAITAEQRYTDVILYITKGDNSPVTVELRGIG